MEVDKVVGNREVRYEDLSKLKTLHNVVNETMRLRPPVPCHSRQSNADLSLSAYCLFSFFSLVLLFLLFSLLSLLHLKILCFFSFLPVVPKGTTLLICVGALHNNKEWKNSQTFNPSRFNSSHPIFKPFSQVLRAFFVGFFFFCFLGLVLHLFLSTVNLFFFVFGGLFLFFCREGESMQEKSGQQERLS